MNLWSTMLKCINKPSNVRKMTHITAIFIACRFCFLISFLIFEASTAVLLGMNHLFLCFLAPAGKLLQNIHDIIVNILASQKAFINGLLNPKSRVSYSTIAIRSIIVQKRILNRSNSFFFLLSFMIFYFLLIILYIYFLLNVKLI